MTGVQTCALPIFNRQWDNWWMIYRTPAGRIDSRGLFNEISSKLYDIENPVYTVHVSEDI